MTHVVCTQMSVNFPIIGASRSFRSEIIGQKVGGLFKTSGGVEPQGKGVTVAALQDITFSLTAGDRLGLIGHNGAGKSTLLRTLAGAYVPTSGSLVVRGNTVPILSLGAGMDSEFTGYENILLCGLHLGMTREEVARKMPEIAAFTELGDFLNLPVRTYSSGMVLRLSYAVATSVDPEILLIDEVFGVGDAGFFIKAKQRMEATLARSRILVLATHSTALIAEYCNRVCVLSKGTIQYSGTVDEGIEYYNSEVLRQALE
jgi:ABC-type polysaccharide/polyol phosphate transport system ATPase subunit